MATMSGAYGYRAIADFVAANKKELSEYLDLKGNQVPSHVTIRTIVMGLNFKELTQNFYEWAKQIVPIEKGEWICGDGKCLKSTVTDYDSDRQDFVNLVSLYCQKQGMVINAMRINNGKESEIPAMRELIRMLGVKGSVITLDALHCQTETVNTIIESGNDYVIKVKGNQPKLLNSIKNVVKTEQPIDSNVTRGRKSGRDETRCVQIYEAPVELRDKWDELYRCIYVKRTRCIKGQTGTTHSYYISSHKSNDAAVFNQGIRGHWLIENQLHYVKDVVQNEDDNGIAHNDAATTISILKNFAINMLKIHGYKSMTKAKRFLANKIVALCQILQIRT